MTKILLMLVVLISASVIMSGCVTPTSHDLVLINNLNSTNYTADEIYINLNASNSFNLNETKLNMTIDDRIITTPSVNYSNLSNYSNFANYSQFVNASNLPYDNDSYYVNKSGDNMIGNLNISAGLFVSNDTFLYGNLTVGKDIWVNGSIYPNVTLNFDLGSGANRWKKLFVANISAEHIDTYTFVATDGINVSNSLNVTGNINQSTGNSTINVPYASIYNYTDGGYTFSIPSPGVYYNITGLIAGYLNGFTYTGGNQTAGGSYVTAQIAGKYAATMHISAKAASTTGEQGFCISKNWANCETQMRCYARHDMAVSVQNIGVTCILDLAVGDKVAILVDDETNPARDIVIQTAGITLTRVGS